MTREFERLLFRAEIDNWSRGLWFKDCELVANVILCPDAMTRDALERLFGQKLRSLKSDIAFRVGPVPQVTKAEPPTRYKFGIGTKDPAQRGRVTPTKPPDLLDR
jgi:hypothetical protein